MKSNCNNFWCFLELKILKNKSPHLRQRTKEPRRRQNKERLTRGQEQVPHKRQEPAKAGKKLPAKRQAGQEGLPAKSRLQLLNPLGWMLHPCPWQYGFTTKKQSPFWCETTKWWQREQAWGRFCLPLPKSQHVLQLYPLADQPEGVGG